jgi:hypothetical protein
MLICIQSFSQGLLKKIAVYSTPAGGAVYMPGSEDGFGGGNVSASVRRDRIKQFFINPDVWRVLKQLSF